MYSLGNMRRFRTREVTWHYCGILSDRWGGPGEHLIPEMTTGLCTKLLAGGTRGSWEQRKEQGAWKHLLILFKDKTSTDSSDTVLSICKRPSSSDTRTVVMMRVWKINIFSKQFPYSQHMAHVLSPYLGQWEFLMQNEHKKHALRGGICL